MVDISTVFVKINIKTEQEYLLLKLPLVSLKQIEKFMHLSFRTLENFSNLKPRPQVSGNVRISGDHWGGGGGEWSGLELTNT